MRGPWKEEVAHILLWRQYKIDAGGILVAMTFKTRRDGQEKAAFAVWFTLTRQEVAAVERLSAARNLDCRQFLKKIVHECVARTIEQGRAK